MLDDKKKEDGRNGSSSSTSQSVSIHTCVLGFLIAAGFIFCYASVLATLASQWSSNETYSHGFFIPLISGYILWISREKLAQYRPRPNYAAGAIILFVGASMLLGGQLGAVVVVQEVSLIITIFGLVVLIFGTRILKAVWLPIAYLSLMIPMWEWIIDRLYPWFQNFSATIGATLLAALGIPVYHQGVYIQLPNITVEVARQCAGINYLIGILTIGIPVALIFLRNWTKRIFLLSFAVAVALFANSLRILLIGAFSYYGLSSKLHGPLNTFQALFVSVLGFAALFGCLLVLTRGRFKTAYKPGIHKGEHLENPPVSPQKSLLLPTIIAIVLLFSLGSFRYLQQPKPIPLPKDLKQFPLQLNMWSGSEVTPSFDGYRELRIDRDLSRVYQTTGGNSIELYVGYFEYQAQGKELIHDKVSNLYRHASSVRINLNPESHIKVSKVLEGNQDKRRLILFWYDLNGRIVTGKYTVKLYTAWDALFRGRTNGTVIIVSTEIGTEEHIGNKMTAMEGFVKEIFPVLSNFLPGH